MAIRAMAEVGVDISGHTSDQVDGFVGQVFNVVLTVCDSARESCPVFPAAARVLHRSFHDPDQRGLDDDDLYEFFKRIRDEMGEYCRELLKQGLES